MCKHAFAGRNTQHLSDRDIYEVTFEIQKLPLPLLFAKFMVGQKMKKNILTFFSPSAHLRFLPFSLKTDYSGAFFQF